MLLVQDTKGSVKLKVSETRVVDALQCDDIDDIDPGPSKESYHWASEKRFESCF